MDEQGRCHGSDTFKNIREREEFIAYSKGKESALYIDWTHNYKRKEDQLQITL